MNKEKPLNNKELKEFLKINSSNTGNGFSPRAILDSNGLPVPIDEFMELIGERRLRTYPDFSKTAEEKETVRAAKSVYKQFIKRTIKQ
jgi:hypothetical protein